jgi:hypothetical protein
MLLKQTMHKCSIGGKTKKIKKNGIGGQPMKLQKIKNIFRCARIRLPFASATLISCCVREGRCVHKSGKQSKNILGKSQNIGISSKSLLWRIPAGQVPPST